MSKTFKIIHNSDILELMDILDEVSDPQIVATVREGKEAIRRGNAGIPVLRTFRKFREHRK